ncbi:uncharacterized protein LOC129614949 [Condylostylus longicornis]|uniref:uncharacterized protein LOC129614949 n=1 Tax=Condylostylus longicornis TaxID=2530218 RepID=UPI00244E5406|nr:uncharacterized protein LOC129614949 [Condylostylus longicornis]
MMSNNQFKLIVSSEMDYRNLTRAMNRTGPEWDTYEKPARSIKVMVRNLQPSCEEEDIIEDLSSKGYKILDSVYINLSVSQPPDYYNNIDEILDSVKENISPYQHGFMRGRSTTSNLYVFLHSVHNAVARGFQVDDRILLLTNDSGFDMDCSFLSFADETKIFTVITCLDDCYRLQLNIERFYKWCSLNGFILNIEKCKIMRFYRTKSCFDFNYNLNNSLLNVVDETKDLGVVLDRKLTFNAPIDFIISKAFSMLGFIKRNCSQFCDPYTFKSLFTSLVRPHLEYAAPIWMPSYTKHIKRIESVQKNMVRFSLRKFICEMNATGYIAKCKLIDIQTLESRRNVASVIYSYDILSARINCPFILNLYNIYAPIRNVKARRVLYLDSHRTNYGFSEPIANSQRLLNVCASQIDFHYNRDKLKREITKFFH